MHKSTEVNEIAAALAKAQGEMGHAIKDATNPHFRSQYATLVSVIEAVREALSKNGVFYWQPAETDPDGNVCVTTHLIHSSGQWVASELKMAPGKKDAQGVGATITYARRYGLMAACGIAPGDDDDANVIVAKNTRPRPVPADRAPKPPMPDTPEAAVPFEDHEGKNQCTYMLPGEAKSLQAAIDQDMSAASEKGADAVSAAWELHRASIALLSADAQAALKKKGQDLLGVNRRAGKEAVAQHEGEPDPTPTVGPPTPPPAAYDMPDIPPILDRRPNGGARK